MNSQFEDLTKTTKRITFNMPYEEYKDAFEGIVNDISSVAKHRGFRPGKVPKNLILEKYEPEIRSRLVGQVINPELEKLVKDSNMTILSNFRNMKLSFGPDVPIELTAEFDILPPIELPDLSQITLEVPTFPEALLQRAADTEFASFVEKHSAEYKQALPYHEITYNDQVTFMERLFLNGKEIIRKKNERRPKTQVVTKEGGYNFYTEALLGHKVGDEYEVPYQVPPTDKNRAIAGKKVTLRIEILYVDEFVRIPIETFINELGSKEFKTVDELKGRIYDQIKQVKLNSIEKAKRIDVIKKITSMTEIPIPKPLLERTFLNILNSMNFPKNIMLSMFDLLHRDDEQVAKKPDVVFSLKNTAIKTIREQQILNKVMAEQNFTATDDEVREHMRELILQQDPDSDEETIQRYLSSKARNTELWDNVSNTVLNNKAYDWILGQVNIVQMSEEETLKRVEELEELEGDEESEGVNDMLAEFQLQRILRSEFSSDRKRKAAAAEDQGALPGPGEAPAGGPEAGPEAKAGE